MKEVLFDQWVSLLLIFSQIGCTATLGHGESGSGMNEVNKANGYFINYTNRNSRRNWEDANAECSRFNASLLDFADEEDILHVAQTNLTRALWIGLTRNTLIKSNPLSAINNTGEFLEVDMWPWCYARDGHGNISYHCNGVLASICVRRNHGGKCEEDWKMNGSYCYLNVYSRLTWFGAFVHCRAKQSEMYVESIHGRSIGATMTGQKYWIALAKRRSPNPVLGWEWMNSGQLQWDEAKEIVVHDHKCSGCSYVHNRTLYLTLCHRNRLFLCNNNSSSVNPYIPSERYSIWETASSKCEEQYGDNSSLVELSANEHWESLENLYSSGSIKPDKSYWIGLRKKINSSEETCITTNIFAETNVTDYRVRECSSISCSGHLRSEGDGKCEALYHPVCVKDAANVISGRCESSWTPPVVNSTKCVRTFTKVRMGWLAAYRFCQAQGGELLPRSMGNVLSHYHRTPVHGRCWVNDYKVFLPQDPLEGWKWPNGSLLKDGHSGEITANVRDIIGKKRCAYFLPKRLTWEDSYCGHRRHFICKKKLFIDPAGPSLSTEGEIVRKESLGILRSAGVSISCQQKNCTIQTRRNGNTTEKQSVEELMFSTQRRIVELVNSSTFMDSFEMVENNIELTVYTTKFTNLHYEISNMTSVPIKSIEKMCQNRSSCIIKGVIMKLNNVTISLSKWLDAPEAKQADTISVDYLVDGQLVSKLDVGEKVSVNFQQETEIKEGRVFCMFLDGLEWDTKGMKVGLMDNDNVECVTDHFSSFAMVVLDSEPSKLDKVALKFISYIGSGLSLVGLVFTCLVYIVLYKDLQILTTSRHLVHFNLQIALGLTQIVFLAGGSATHDEIACKVVAILLHYVSLASFCWILLEAAMLYLKLISVYGGEFVKMRNFYAFGWGFPLIFIGLSSGLKIDAYGSDNWCWLSYEKGFFWVFFAPVILVTTVTFLVLIAVARVLFHAAKVQSSNMKFIVSAARGVIILFPTLGLSWTFSVIAVNHEAMIWKYLFVISTSTQGFLIFLIYGICNREIRSAIRRRIEINPTTSTT